MYGVCVCVLVVFSLVPCSVPPACVCIPKNMSTQYRLHLLGLGCVLLLFYSLSTLCASLCVCLCVRARENSKISFVIFFFRCFCVLCFSSVFSFSVPCNFLVACFHMQYFQCTQFVCMWIIAYEWCSMINEVVRQIQCTPQLNWWAWLIQPQSPHGHLLSEAHTLDRLSLFDMKRNERFVRNTNGKPATDRYNTYYTLYYKAFERHTMLFPIRR